MSGEPSKMHGKTDEVVGGIKSSVGGMMGNHEMQGKGEAQKKTGTGEVNAATAKAHMDATGTKAQGTMEKVIGSVTGDKSKQAEGDAHKAQGDVQHRAA